MLASTAEMELYRIVQEALNNAVRHARAASVAVDVDTTDGTVTITVRDDGVGFDPAARAIASVASD